MAMIYKDSVPISQIDRRSFFSLTISPVFIRKQRKILAVFMVLTALGWSMSANWYRAAVREDGYDDLELVARERLMDLDTDCAKAVHGSFSVDNGPANLPCSRVSFRQKDGSQMAYYEHEGSLYRDRNGNSQKILDGLLSAFFLLPSQPKNSLLVELQFWKGNDSGDMGPALIQKQIDVSRLDSHSDIMYGVISDIKHSPMKSEEIGT